MSSSTAKLHANQQPLVQPAVALFQHEDDQRQRRFELVNSLQATLELNEQLQTFLTWLNQSVAIDGLKYRNPQHNLDLSFGTDAPHRHNYRLQTDAEMLGEIEFCRRQRSDEETLSEIETALSALLYPIRNALRYHVAVQTALRDPLTGTGNRIALDNALHRECQLAERYAQSVSLLVLDIDHFKHVNDNYGHAAGDEVLKQVADSINTVTRETDMTFRYGGEEFVVVLSKTALPEALQVGERIRSFIEQQTFCTQAGHLRVNVSVGTSSLQQHDNIKDLFNRADQALYRAKNQGRNQVVSA